MGRPLRYQHGLTAVSFSLPCTEGPRRQFRSNGGCTRSSRLNSIRSPLHAGPSLPVIGCRRNAVRDRLPGFKTGNIFIYNQTNT